MSPRARDRYGPGSPGPEVKWKGRQPERKKRRKAARKWKPRPPLEKPSKPKPVTVCQAPTCPFLRAEVVAGRLVCPDCASRIDSRAAGLRERQARKDHAA